MDEKRKEIFRTLVELQDNGCETEKSRLKIADQFRISVLEVQDIEREGIANQWPPLE
jgi:hypothetical protein